MKFTLKLDLPDAEQEAVWLQEYLEQEAIPGLESEIVKQQPADGTMAAELLTELIKLAATTAVGEVMKSVISLVFDHFKGKKAKLELSGQCPDNGQQFKLSFETGGEKERAAAIAEFNALMAELCGHMPTTNPNEA